VDHYELIGFETRIASGRAAGDTLTLVSPYWVLAVFFSVAPVLWLWRTASRRAASGFPIEPSFPS
jgi:hypothetical protein